MFRAALYCIASLALVVADMPLPFYRELKLSSPEMTGSDVIIAQNLLLRDSAVTAFEPDGLFAESSDQATKDFQSANGLTADGVLGESTAALLLELHSADGVKDTGFTAASMGYLYKFFIPVYNNRSIETAGVLYDKNNNILLTFPVRTHGHRDDGSPNADWPDMGNGDIGLNQFSSNGATVTGIVEVDLNSPEPDPALYGPWPVNRVVRGLEGNGAFLLPNIRDGILLHTGNWTSAGYTPFTNMPNSAGCMHSHPEHVERIYKALVHEGVVVNDNTFSGKDYPYKPQGIAVIEQQDV